MWTPSCGWSIVVVLLVCAVHPITGQSTGSTIYAQGDLILVNPQQSTAIFVSVLVFSTLFAYLMQWLMGVRNRYQRSIVVAIKEEVTCMTVAELLLLWATFSFPLSDQWKSVIQFVALCLIYMALYYSIAVMTVTVLQGRQMNKWRLFEWAKLGADATHGRDEQTLKMCRHFYLSMLPFDVGADPSNLDEDLDPNAMILFTSAMTMIERRHMKAFTDFTPLTWLGLFFVITVNGFRALTVGTVGLDTTSLHIAQSMTFIALCGYGTFLVFIVASQTLLSRLFRNLFNKAASNGGTISQTKLTDEQRTADVEEMTKCLFFRSIPATLQIFKVVLLSQVWYLSMMTVGIFYVLWRDLGWYSLIIFPIAILPPVVTVLIYPTALTRTMMCCVVGVEFDIKAARGILAGDFDVNDVELTAAEIHGVDDDAELIAKADEHMHKKRAQNDDADSDLDLPDEVQGVTVNLHSGTQIHTSPSKVLGVRPVLNERTYVVTNNRPVFDDTANLRVRRDDL